MPEGPGADGEISHGEGAPHGLGAHVLTPGLSFRVVIAEALFVLVMLELQRLLIIYLRDHHVSVDVMIEVAIVAVLREVALLSAIEIEPLRLLVLTAFVLALGFLLRFGDLRAPRHRVRAHGGSPPRRPSPPARGRAP